MSTPVATVADALISFILSLLRDPAAVEKFDAAPTAVLASKGLQDACAADVQAVKPIIVDNPTVIVKPVPVGPPPPPDPPHSDEVVKEIKHIINQFATIDNRTTIVDQSTNQNIWTEGGDVTQIFDQEAVIASGDESVAAGDDATVVDSEVDVTIGDVAIGNTTNDGSFNNTGVDPETAGRGRRRRPRCRRDPADAAAIAGDAVETAVDQTLDATASVQEAVQEPVAEAPVAEVAAEDPLAADLTAADSYESEDAGTAVVDDAFVEEPVEEQ